ncbi:MAG: radical SAM protein [Gemmatimonadota bacterium]|nr:radical SAM protein [Gemmatimonadota bacterium]
MKKLTKKETAAILGKGIPRYLKGYPTVVSFEMTHSCNANCHHCNMGGMIKDEKRIAPADYRRLMNTLKPVIVQISGGEPLLRDDLGDVMRAIKPEGSITPYLIVVTNGRLLNRERYLAMRDAGLSQLSISLCFPDKRHDKWRRVKGLYDHLDRVVPELVSMGYDDIVLNSAITSENMHCIMDLAHTAERWGVSISFSAYSVLRTGEREYTIESPEKLEKLRSQLEELKAYKQENCGHILNADFNIDGTYEFFQNGEIGGCSAGRHFLVVTPDGYLKPCSMHDKNYTSLSQIRESFVPNNHCGSCYVSIRSYLDKSLPELVREYFSSHSMRPKGYAGREQVA